MLNLPIFNVILVLRCGDQDFCWACFSAIVGSGLGVSLRFWGGFVRVCWRLFLFIWVGCFLRAFTVFGFLEGFTVVWVFFGVFYCFGFWGS
jgi:hypothetical protein